MLLAFLEFTPNNCQLFGIKGVYEESLSNHVLCLFSVFKTHSTITKLALAS